MNQCIKKSLNELFIKKDLNSTVPERELTFVLSYLGKLSRDLRTRLRRTIERDLPYCKLKVIFKSNCRFNTPFRLNLSVHLTHRFDLKIHLKEKFALEKFIVIRVVTARLLIMEKLSATFKPEQLNT